MTADFAEHPQYEIASSLLLPAHCAHSPKLAVKPRASPHSRSGSSSIASRTLITRSSRYLVAHGADAADAQFFFTLWHTALIQMPALGQARCLAQFPSQALTQGIELRQILEQ